MKKVILYSLSALVMSVAIFISCKPKNESDAITPTYKQEGGTGGNVNPGVTTTGTVAVNNNPSASSSMNVAGGSWQNPLCDVPTGVQKVFTTTNSTTGSSVKFVFSGPPTTQAYTTTNNSNPGLGQVYILVTNPTSQPANSQWESAPGKIINVTVTGGLVSITYTGIICNQVGGTSFFNVTISGTGGCN